MKTHLTPQTIDDYVAQLDRALRGPKRLRRDLVTEARDGLIDAAQAYEADGVQPREAQGLAVADFGAIAEVAPSYQEELAAGQGRRTAAMLFITVPLTALLWAVVWMIYPVAPGDVAKPGWFGLVARLVDLGQLAMGVLGALALIALRRWRRPERITRFLGLVVWIVFPIQAAMCLSLAISSPEITSFADYVPGLVVNSISIVLWTWQLWSATRALTVTGSAPARSPG